MDFATPIISVNILLINHNKIFLIQRANTCWEDGKWSIPGGRVELGSTIKQTAVRELFEKTALKAHENDLEFVHIEYLKDKFINYFFKLEPQIINIIPQEQEKVSDFGWYDLDNLPTPIAANGQRVLDFIKRREFFSE